VTEAELDAKAIELATELVAAGFRPPR